MSARGKIALMVGLAALAVLSAMLIVRSDWFRQQVHERIVREVERATGGRAEIGEFRFDWRELRADLRSFTLHGTEGPGEPPLFSARSVQVGLRVFSAFRRDIDIERLRLEQPRVRVVVYADGRTNLPQPEIARRSNLNAIEQMLALAIRNFSVEDGLLELDSRKIPLNLEAERVELRLFYDQRGPAYTGRIESDAVRLRAPFALPSPLRLSSALMLRGDEIRLSDVSVSTNQSTVRMNAGIRGLAAPRAEFRFDSDLSLDELSKFLRVPAVSGGRLALAGNGSFGGSSGYRFDGRLSGTGLVYQHGGIRLSGIRLTSRFESANAAVTLSDVSVSALGGVFKGAAALKPAGDFRVEGELNNLSLEAVSRIVKSELPGWNGRVSGPVQLTGKFTGSRIRQSWASLRLAVMAEAGARPVQGAINMNYDQATGSLELVSSYLATSASRVQFEGALGRGLRVSARTADLNDFAPAIAALSDKPFHRLPVMLVGGALQFEGLVRGSVQEPRVEGRCTMGPIVFEGRRIESLAATVSLSPQEGIAREVKVESQGTLIEGNARVGWRNWIPGQDSDLDAAFSIQNLKIERLLSEAGVRFPATGTVSGALRVTGTIGSPEAAGRLQLTAVSLYGQRFEKGSIEARFDGGVLNLASAKLDDGQLHIEGSGAYVPRKGDWRSGPVRFEIVGRRLAVSRLRGSPVDTSLGGWLDVDVSGDGAVESSRFRLASLKGKARASDLTIEGRPAGELNLVAETGGGALSIRAGGKIAGAEISGRSRWRLDGDYAAEGDLRFTRLSLSSLQPWLRSANRNTRLPIEGKVDGRITFSGEGLDPNRWRARVEIPVFEIAPETAGVDPRIFRLANDGPIVLGVDRTGLRFERARIVGAETDLEASGLLGFGSANALQMRIRGDVNLAVLHDLDPDLTASGHSTLDATIRGRLSEPEIFGRMEFRDGSFYLSDVPNGIDKASGVILFSRDRATIEKLTAETGGGRLSFSGFVGFGGPQVVYRVQAGAQQVRVRYPDGVSTTLNAALSLTGTSTNSTLSGDVTVLRSSVSPRVDLAGMLARSSKPLVTPGTQNKLLRGMLFDVYLRTSPNARIESALTQDIQAEADLRLRGTPYKPVLLGRISATQGDINFLGTKYSINRGDVSFLNPVKLEPVVNLDLGTRVMGTEVSITFTGPLDRLNVTYRSDPPLQPAEIIALLAVGRAPSTDPTVTARQAELDQSSLGQLGATTLIGEALAAPVTGRLQRFFGVSRIRIDPRLTGVENNPQTQLTLEQQVSRDVTFTYITNLSRTQEQIVRVEWNVNRRWSVVAVRDENGLFGIDVLFRKQFR